MSFQTAWRMLHCLQVCASRSRVDTEARLENDAVSKPHHVRFCNWRSHRAAQPQHSLRSPIYFFVTGHAERFRNQTHVTWACRRQVISCAARHPPTCRHQSHCIHSKLMPVVWGPLGIWFLFFPILFRTTWVFFVWALRPAAPCNGWQRQHQH